MSLEWGKLFYWIKPRPTIYFAVALAAATVLILPANLLTRLGLNGVLLANRPWFGGALLLSTALLLAHALAWVFQNANSPLQRWWQERQLRGFLRTLSPPEKAVLNEFLEGNTTTGYYEISNGVVNGLVQKRILWLASNVAAHFTTFPFNLQPWAWEYLRKHPDVLQ